MTFRDDVERGLGAVVILAGSGSDRTHVKTVYDAVRKYSLPVEARVKSAHKQSGELVSVLREYDEMNGPLVYIAVAGGNDALSGTASWETNRPVISCPPDNPNNSCLTNPPGSSNAYVARAANAARLAAQIFSFYNPACAEALNKERAKKLQDLAIEDALFCGGDFEDPKTKK